MSYDVNKVIAVAQAEIGYLEKASNSNLDDKTANAGSANYTKYARDLDALNYYNGKKNGYAWCDVFVDWCFYKAYGEAAALAMTYQPKGGAGAGCTYSAGYYQKNNALSTVPHVGDQIFFGSASKCTHTGLVYKVDNSYVYTIEGNTSSAAGVVANGGCVRAKQYARGYGSIYAYGHPNYGAEAVSETVTDEKGIWEYLYKHIGNAFGVAALMGNLKAESNLKANNLQNSYEGKLGYTDETYTAAVDSGAYIRAKFAGDSAGYGLAQWTYSTRKAALYDYAKAQSASIGSLTMQLEFLLKELSESYASVLSALKSAASVRSASDAVVTKFERPADQSETALAKRASYGETFYQTYAGNAATVTESASEPISADVARQTFLDNCKSILGGITLDKTITVSATKNRKHAIVLPIQCYLNDLGYAAVGSLDGIAGKKFTIAVKAYQGDHGCEMDGEITKGCKTWKCLLGLI